MKLIDKDALVAEINKRIIDAPINNIGHQRVWAYNDVKDILSTLETKEVDLENYYHNFLQKEWFDKDCSRTISEMMAFTAKHFYELGLKAQKGDKL